jgi:hypothetical protein
MIHVFFSPLILMVMVGKRILRPTKEPPCAWVFMLILNDPDLVREDTRGYFSLRPFQQKMREGSELRFYLVLSRNDIH